MATLRYKRKLAAINRDDSQELSRNNQARDRNVHRSQEDYVTHFSEEIEGRLTNKLSQEFSRTKSRILGALSKLSECLLNTQAWVHSWLVPETSRNWNGVNQETIEDRSQNDPDPEVCVSLTQSSQELSPGETSYNVTNGQHYRHFAYHQEIFAAKNAETKSREESWIHFEFSFSVMVCYH